MSETLTSRSTSSRENKKSIKELPHKVFVFFLGMIGVVTTITIWVQNYSYYFTPLDLRPALSRYEMLRPSGLVSHGYGVIGTAMVFVGVAIYSGRKRLRALSNFGKIRDFLDFHIFLCLLGPVLVLFHTTFLFGGIAGAGFWCMTAIVASGLVGRYFYRFIPKNIAGNELTSADLESERAQLLESMISKYKLDRSTVGLIDSIGVLNFDENKAGLFQLLWYLAVVDLTHRINSRKVIAVLRERSVPRKSVKEISRIAKRRIVLRQKLLVLEKTRQLFHYWHVIHLPFSLVMLVILIVHVGVAIAFGYTWIF